MSDPRREGTPASSKSLDARVDEVIAEYLNALQRGDAPDREEIVRRHPELASELRRFFDHEQSFDRVHAKAYAPAGSVDPNRLKTGETREFGEYELLEEIGRGGMGVVYRARHKSLGRIVALKVVLGGRLAGSEDARRFKIEASAAARLNHPNIVSVYEVGEVDGCPYFTMALIDGVSLSERLSKATGDDKRAPFSGFRAAASLVAQLARAVAHAHVHGVIHRDLKPSNVLLSTDGRPFVTDFGLARLLESDESLTRTGALVGTPSYMAPEQAEGESDITTAADVYSLGVILYELIAGQPPFCAESSVEIIRKVATEEPPSLRRGRNGIPTDLEIICLRCLEKDPRRRFSSVIALAEDLECFLAAKPILSKPSTVTDRLIKWSRRRPALATLWAVLLLTTIAFVGFSTYYNVQLGRSAERERERADEAEELATAARRILRSGTTARAWKAHENNYLERARFLLKAARLHDSTELRDIAWHHLHRRVNLERPPQAVDSRVVGFSPDGKHLVTAGDDGAGIQLRDPQSGVLLETLAQGGREVQSLTFSSNGSYFAYSTRNQPGDTHIWSLARRERIGTLESHGKEVLDVALSSDGRTLVSGEHESKLYVSSADRGWRSQLVQARGGSVEAVAISPLNGIIAYSTSADDEIVLWDAARQAETKRLPIDGYAYDLAFSPDGSILAVATSLGKLVIWRTEGYEPIVAIDVHRDGVRALAFSPDSSRLASVGGQGRLLIWRLEPFEQESSVLAHLRTIYDVAFSPDGKTISTVGEDGLLKLWSLADLEGPIRLPGHASPIWDLGVCGEESFFVTGDDDHRYLVWRFRESSDGIVFENPALLPPLPSGPGTYISLSPDGRRLVVSDSNVQILRLVETGDTWSFREEHKIPAYSRISGAEFAPDSRFVAIASADRVEVLRRTDSDHGSRWNQICRFDAGLTNVKLLAFSPSRQFLAVGSRANRTIELWDIRRTAKLGNIDHPSSAKELVFSPNGRYLSVGGSRGTVTLWRIDSNKGKTEEWAQLTGHTRAVDSIVFSADGSQIATGSEDENLRLWSIVETREGAIVVPQATLRGQRSAIRALAFTRNEQILISVGGKAGRGEILVWQGE